jgi:glycosyltransferase involved in cell wall biosynthesis
LRLLMLGWRGPHHPRAGGAEQYTRAVLRELVARGHDVTWFCEGPQSESLDGVRVVAGPPAPALYPAGAWFLRRHAAAFDVVIDQINVTGFLAPLHSPRPVVALIHQLTAEVWRAELPPPWGAMGPPLERALLAAYRRTPFVTVSETTRSDLRRLGWRGPGAVAYNGVERPPAAALPAKEGAPTLAFLGRWQARAKRVAHAFEAFARVRAHLPAAQLWAMGRGRPPAVTPPGVLLLRDLSDAERDDRLARAWLLVATSVREGWGRMVVEAAAVGTPAAVYDVPGLAEAGRAVGATVVPPRPQDLAQAVQTLLQAPEALHAMGREARRRVAAFTWSAAADVWEGVLAGAALGPRP